ncbi:GNAT family N-acetyltransferase [Patescibacteria group bacterium]|nr:GNAT family N-acetyltransferase [Patescibacteria group bacterium]
MEFISSLENVKENDLQGFFVGWQNPPTPARHLELLRDSDYVLLALDPQSKKVVGFATAITDKHLAAYIPFLEVLPEYQKRGIGKELVTRMLLVLKEFYMIDLLCDTELQVFYEDLGMKKAAGMMQRNYTKQNGI